jgi:hypothetical protein
LQFEIGVGGALMSAEKGIDRRTIIKAAAAAGGGAWVAPLIVDSLASPAAAASHLCTRWMYQAIGANCSFAATPTNSTNNCDPTGWATATNGSALPQTIGTNAITLTTCSGKSGTWQFDISGTGTCTFATGGGYDNAGGVCNGPSITLANKRLNGHCRGNNLRRHAHRGLVLSGGRCR